MKVQVIVIPKSSRNSIIAQADGTLKVYLTVPPIDGKANEAAIALLSKHFRIRKSAIRIVRGMRSRNKTIEIIY